MRYLFFFIPLLIACSSEDSDRIKVGSAEFSYKVPKGWTKAYAEELDEGENTYTALYELKHKELDTVIAILRFYSYSVENGQFFPCEERNDLMRKPSPSSPIQHSLRTRLKWPPNRTCDELKKNIRVDAEEYQYSAIWQREHHETTVLITTVVNDTSLIDYERLANDFVYTVESLEVLK